MLLPRLLKLLPLSSESGLIEGPVRRLIGPKTTTGFRSLRRAASLKGGELCGERQHCVGFRSLRRAASLKEVYTRQLPTHWASFRSLRRAASLKGAL